MGDLVESFFSRAGIGGTCAMAFFAAGREPGDGDGARRLFSQPTWRWLLLPFSASIFSRTSFTNPFSQSASSKGLPIHYWRGLAVCRSRTPGTWLVRFFWDIGACAGLWIRRLVHVRLCLIWVPRCLCCVLLQCKCKVEGLWNGHTFTATAAVR